jgi:hypothetical protein
VPTTTISRCGGGAAGITLDEVITASSPDAWWKLNEAAGNTAVDSSGNGHDLTTDAGYTNPTWAQPSGPPGTQTALFNKAPNATRLSRNGYAALPAEFSALGWFNRTDNGQQALIGQGTCRQAGFPGWQLDFEAFNQGATNRAILFIGSGGGPNTLEGDNALTVGLWHFIGVVRQAGVFTLYVNGAAQSTTSAAAYTATTGVWVSNDNAALGFNGYGSYCMTFGRALSAAAIGAIYSAA